MEFNVTLKKLVDKYQALTPKRFREFNEANTANAFIRPLFEILGWDFSDVDEVAAEQAVMKGRVDYVLKIDKVTRLCLEVKALRHELTDADRRQAISYAYNKGVTWAVLTNFAKLEVFNAEVKTNDLMSVRFISLADASYVKNSAKLALLSRESISRNRLDEEAIGYGRLARRVPIERRLYEDLITWRESLFNEVYLHNKNAGVTMDQADTLVEKLFSRLIFIRTAEDRGLAGNHPLLSALHQWQSAKVPLLARVLEVFQDFAGTFDSELFPKIDPWQGIWIDDNTLAEVIDGLYTVPNDFATYHFNVIEPDVFGQIYEQYLGYVARVARKASPAQQTLFPSTDVRVEMLKKQEKRKKSGIYYTPKWITDFIVRNTVTPFLERNSHHDAFDVRIVDPACGSGSFLIRAYDELLTYHAKTQGKTPSALSWPERIRILTRNIFGVDLDLQAVEIARLNLLIRALARRDALPPLEENIKCGNSLIYGSDEQLKACLGADYLNYHPFNWVEGFSSVMQRGGFDVVIGNPPYVMELRRNKDVFQPLRNTPLGQKYYESKMDIFYFFIELGLDLLKPNGYLGFVVQQYWLSRTHASKLREKVFSEAHPLILVDFGDYQVFPGAPGQHNMIVILRKAKGPQDTTLLLTLKTPDVSERELVAALAAEPRLQSVFDVKVIKSTKLFDVKVDKVLMVDNETTRVMNRLLKGCWHLGDAEVQIGADVHQPNLRADSLPKLASPALHKPGDGIFVVSNAEVQRLKLNLKEKALLKPFHYAEELDSYSYDQQVARWLIYTPVPIAREIKDNPGMYPNLTRHLDAYAPVITSDHAPYGIHRARQAEWFDDKNKIVGVRKTRRPRFVVIPDQWYGDQAVLIIRLVNHTDVSLHFLTAILNSTVATFWLYQEKRQGTQLQIDKEVLLHFPFPKMDNTSEAFRRSRDNVVKLAISIADWKRQLAALTLSGQDLFGEQTKVIEQKVAALISEVDTAVCQIYGLGERESKDILARYA